MTLAADELLARMSRTLRDDIAPAVGDEYTRTQTFMASVILARLSKQIELAPAHQAAESLDVAALVETLTPILADSSPEVRETFAAFASGTSVVALSPLIEALYNQSVEPDLRDRALVPIREVLRRDIDRAMEVAS